MHDFGFLRIAAAIPSVNVADCSYNIKSIINQIDQACQHNAEVVLFPELSVTGYSCADLFAQSVLLDSAVAGLEAIRQHSAGLGDVLIVVGAPLKNGDKLFNTAVAICQGCYVGVVPKTFLPNYNGMQRGLYHYCRHYRHSFRHRYYNQQRLCQNCHRTMRRPMDTNTAKFIQCCRRSQRNP